MQSEPVDSFQKTPTEDEQKFKTIVRASYTLQHENDLSPIITITLQHPHDQPKSLDYKKHMSSLFQIPTDKKKKDVVANVVLYDIHSDRRKTEAVDRDFPQQIAVKIYTCDATDDQNKQTKFNTLVTKEKEVIALFNEKDELRASDFVHQINVLRDEQNNNILGTRRYFIVIMPWYKYFLDRISTRFPKIQLVGRNLRNMFLQLLRQLKIGRKNGYYYLDVKPSNIAIHHEIKSDQTSQLFAKFADLNSVDLKTYRPLLSAHTTARQKYPLSNVFLWLLYTIGETVNDRCNNIFQRRLRKILDKTSKLFFYPPCSTPSEEDSFEVPSSSMLLYLVNTLYNRLYPLFFTGSDGENVERTFFDQVCEHAFTQGERTYLMTNDFEFFFNSSRSEHSFEYLLLLLLSA